ncbi:hypothetical protein AZE42_05391 [Rhizopogon vesiculosus]|uniref:Protein kinase domain-containing protein n=1 Tax=Rhizopogon vesiculosus TaxID=180088 RepID=A0A1J8QER3_9AGAM|nr:hypothetical protein AZE42_05391 [Rhizopogon vesiculosus]
MNVKLKSRRNLKKLVLSRIAPHHSIVVCYTTFGIRRGAEILQLPELMHLLHFLLRVWQCLTTIGVKRYYTATPYSISNLTGKIRKVDLSGGGRSADVYKATYSTGATSRQVAVKSLRITITDHTKQSESQKLLAQVNSWTALQHDNILTPLGYVDGFGPLPSIVYDWMPGGTLTSYLQDNSNRLSVLQRLTLASLV